MQFVLALLVLLLSSNGLASTAKPLLNWATNTAPPFHIVGGAFDQQGIL